VLEIPIPSAGISCILVIVLQGITKEFHQKLVLIIATSILLIAPIMFGRVRPVPQTREVFEVVSIKPKKFEPGMVGIEFLPGGFVRGMQAPMPMIIWDAYNISMRQLDLQKIAPSVFGEVYDFEARAGTNALPATAPAEERTRQLRRMMQSLLADRFKLVLHREAREVSVYALVIAPGGPKLLPALADRKCPDRPDPSDRFAARCGVLSGGPASGTKGFDVDIGKLVETLEGFGDRLIVDRTGLKGRYDISLPPWNRSVAIQPVNDGREPAEDPNGPSIFTVLQRTLGLRLESTRAQVEIYVVDHIERPTPN